MKKTILFICAMLVGTVIANCKQKDFTLLYWNIQNGMWCDQANNYDNFVEYVKKINPDICVWCEAKTIYKNGTDQKADRAQCYLPGNWDMLAARYGHSYVYLGGERDNYPQVITSKFPIKNVKRYCGTAPDSLVAHGSGWARIQLNGKTINIVTLHTWPHKHACYINKNDKEAYEKNIAENGGDKYRAMEMQMICRETILTQKDAENQYWMMLGDFNSVSIVDNDRLNYPNDTSKFLVHNYIRKHTPYIDVVKEVGKATSSTYGSARIDFLYMTKPMFDCVTYADFIEPWERRGYCGVNNFYYPSDHMPILCRFTVK